MSFILDALKKSEIERQRQVAPGLIEPAPGRPRAGLTPLTIALLALLGVNLIVLGVVLLRRPAVHPPATAVAAIPAPVATAIPPRAASLPIAGSAGRTAAGPAIIAHGAGPAPSAAPPGDSVVYAPEVPVTSPDNPIVAQARARLGAAGSTPPAAATTAGLAALPTLAQMDFTGTDALPPLHLDVHVYSPNAAERFVFINGHRYIQGSTLREGPIVVRIRPDGVELEYRGRRFLLPRS